MSVKASQRYVIGGGAVVLLLVAIPLFREFSEPGQLAWNLFLTLFVIGLVIGSIALQRYFVTHADEIGEARFDTTNKDDQ